MTLSFPILRRKIHGKRLVYLDNAATTQRPKEVIDALSDFYASHNANINRGVYALSVEATERWDAARERVARFIHALPDEIIFTKGTTEAINIVAHSFESGIRPGDEVIVTVAEHHANFVPWQALCKRKKARLVVLALDKKTGFSLLALRKALSPKTRIVAFSMVSNVLGCATPSKEACALIRKHDDTISILIDGAQAVSHMPVDVARLGCDFFAFSAHKMLGPFGVGVLYCKRTALLSLEPLILGGDMIESVSVNETVFSKGTRKFEGGTQNVAGVIGFDAAIGILEKEGMAHLHKELNDIGTYAWDLLSKVSGVTLHSPRRGNNGIISFSVAGIHPHDIASLLDSEGIAIRAGHHCAQPLMGALGISTCCRASFYMYNTKKDAAALQRAVKKAKKVFHGS
jgi:cysteine desulfurase/selenocysteine lyase